MAEILKYTNQQLVWVDEMGSGYRNAIRKNKYAIRGETPSFQRSLVRGQRITAVAALTVDGIIALKCTINSVDANVFYDFVRSHLIPNMHPYYGVAPRSVVVLDNCSIHHISEVVDLFQRSGVLVRFTVPIIIQ